MEKLKNVVDSYFKINNIGLEQENKKLDPLRDSISSAELIRVSGSDIDIVNAARVSYGKVSKDLSDRDKFLIKYLMDHEHTSPFEHNQLSFRIKCPIFVARQWFRHRMNSYNEISYRYVEAPLEFYVPKHFRFQAKTNKQSSYGQIEDSSLTIEYKKAVDQSFQTYQALLNQGVSREQARFVLPVSTYTEFIYTCNLHSLMHFLKLRLNVQAQYEIRVYAQALLNLAYPHFPIALEAWFEKYISFDIFENFGDNKD